jgi:hypothetical protein
MAPTQEFRRERTERYYDMKYTDSETKTRLSV